MSMDYSLIRAMFGKKMTQSQVDGCELIMAASADMLVSHRAYLLATALHETAATMQPITERGPRAYFDRYEVGTRVAERLGNSQPGDGWLFRGRGFVQITGRGNYYRVGRKIGVDLVADPDAALRPDIAARILVEGCAGGWFTGRSLSLYLPGDYVSARRVVNGTDRADLIAGYAMKFEAALK